MSDAKVLTLGLGEVEELNLQPTLDGKMEVTGFPTDADGRTYFCTLTYDETTRTVTITPTGATFDIFIGGVKYTFTGAQSIVHGAQQGGHYVYFDATGTLVTSQVPWDILSHVPTCYVFRDAISGLSIAWEERHHANRDLYWHANQHYNEGAKARSGFAISGYVLNSSVDANIAFAIASGIVDDEDIAVTTEALPDDGPYTIMRRSGAAGDWVIDRTPVLPFLISGSDAAYNQWTGATWQMTASANNRFLNYYVLAASALPSTAITPASKNQYILIPGQATFNTLALAQAELISAIQWGDIPFQEVAPLYKVTLQRSNGYATTGRCRLAAVARIVGTYVQVTQATNPNHGSLGGLLNDDHQQYPILSSGTVAPTSTPDRVGALYVDTATPALYVGKGIASSADWFNTTGGGGGSSAASITTFDASADFTMAAGTKFVWVIAVGAGGGGGSGGTAGLGVACSGGAGGGGAACLESVFSRAEVLAAYGTGIVPVTIGAGGTGGTAVTSATAANGVDGGIGGNSTFGTLMTAYGGGGGGKGFGAATASTGGSSGCIRGAGAVASTTSTNGQGAGIAGGQSPNQNNVTSAVGGAGCATSGGASSAGYTSGGGAGGAAGAGVSTAGTPLNGARGGPRPGETTNSATTATQGNGGVGGTSGGDGPAPTGGFYVGGGGGGGGASSGVSAAGNGGAGGIGSGGGGGGGCRLIVASGAGGVGGNGRIIVMEY